MQVLKLQNGCELMIPPTLPSGIMEVAVSHDVPELHKRNVRVMPVVLGLVCCECAEHVITLFIMMTLN